MTLLRVALLAMLILAAGCGTEAGRAVPAAPAPPSTAAPSVTGVPGLPPRPEMISLVGLDPCTLLTPEQQAEFGFDSAPLPDVQPSEADAAACSYNSNAGGVRYIAAADTSIAVWFDGSRGGEVTPLMVAGFPAVEIRVESLDPPLCAVAVDVAEGQQLIAQNSPSRSEPPTTDEQCASALRYAEAAMQTLLARSE